MHVGFRVAAAIEQLLPLAHHSHVLVVEDEHLHRQAVLGDGGHLLDVHDHRRLAGDVDDQRLRVGDLHAHGRRQAVAHGAQPARGHPVVGLIEPVMLRRPHLVLAHLGGDVDVVEVLGQLIEPLEGVLRLDDLGAFLILQAVPRPPLVDALPPFGQGLLVGRRLFGLPHLDHVLEHVPHIADDADLYRHVLVDRGRIDVDVDLPGAGREIGEPSGDAVIEPGADGDHDVAPVHGQVGFIGAVHAQHAEVQGVRGRKRTQPHHRQRARKAGQAHELGEQLRGRRSGVDDPAAAIQDGPLGRRHDVDGAADEVDVALHPRLIRPVGDPGDRRVVAHGRHDVLGQIHDDRPRPAAAGHVECLVHHARQRVHVLDQVVVLGAGTGDAGDVGLLEGVVADQVGGHLAGEADDGDAVHEGVGEPGHGVGGARPRGHQDDAHLAGGSGISFRRVHGALLVPDEDVADGVLLEDLVVNRQYGAPRIPEDHVHALFLQGLKQYLGPVHLIVRHRPLPFSSIRPPADGNRPGTRTAPPADAAPAWWRERVLVAQGRPVNKN